MSSVEGKLSAAELVAREGEDVERAEQATLAALSDARKKNDQYLEDYAQRVLEQVREAKR